MQARLTIADASYSLSRSDAGDWIEITLLPAGHKALMPGEGAVDERVLEMAIEHTEDWVMPHAAALTGASLDVVDDTGRLAAGLQDVLSTDAREWTVDQMEDLFRQLDFIVARPRLASALDGRQGFVADIVLLHELAHHAKLRLVRLAD